MKIPRIVKRLFYGGIGVFFALQFVRPSLTNPPVTAEITVPADVSAILRSSCYDCHSNETNLRWFDRIVPGYWLVAKDVREARARLNFSEIGALPANAQRAALFESINQARLGAMPPSQYLLLHPSARLDEAKIDAWEKALVDPKPSTETLDVVVQRTKPIGEVAAAPNGLIFPADYVDWKFVSATNRFDNHTLRLILGNAVAMRAISEKHVRPWPDGTAFVKIAWDATPGGDPSHRKLVQIETMIKDARAHASTEGWGFARWKGDALVPYGKDASFVDECTGCHAPVKDDDFVYTMAIGKGDGSDAWNSEATLPAEFPGDPSQAHVLGTSFDLATGTIATTFGNDTARDYMRAAAPENIRVGATFTRVTWSAQDDRHWFGGKIPGAPKSVETVVSIMPGDGKQTFSYSLFDAHSGQQHDSVVDASLTRPILDAITSAR